MRLPAKLRMFKAHKRLKYVDFADYFTVSEQTIKNWCDERRCPKKLQFKHAQLMVKFSCHSITMKDCGH